MTKTNRSLPTNPQVKDYTNARFAVNAFMDVDLDSAVIGVIPGEGGVARYVYDLALVYRAYAKSYGIEYNGDALRDTIHQPSGETREQILDEIHDNVFLHDWGKPGQGLEPILVADPSMSETERDDEDEDPTPMIFGGRECYLVR